MQEIVFRCRCGGAVPSGLVVPSHHPRAVPRRPVLSVERRCPTCGVTSEFSTAPAVPA